MKKVKTIKCHVAAIPATTNTITKEELNGKIMTEVVEHVVKVIEDINPTMAKGHVAYAASLRGWTFDSVYFENDTDEMLMGRLVHLANSMNQFNSKFWEEASMTIEKSIRNKECGMIETRVFNALRDIYRFCPGLIADSTMAFDNPAEFAKFFWATINNYRKAYGNMHTPASWIVNLYI